MAYRLLERQHTEEIDMAHSSIYRTGEEQPVVNRGHGTGALGPSDSADSGSDILGGPGLNAQDGIGLDRGTTSDPDVDGPDANAGADRRGAEGARSVQAAAVAGYAANPFAPPASAACRAEPPPRGTTLALQCRWGGGHRAGT